MVFLILRRASTDSTPDLLPCLLEREPRSGSRGVSSSSIAYDLLSILYLPWKGFRTLPIFLLKKLIHQFFRNLQDLRWLLMGRLHRLHKRWKDWQDDLHIHHKGRLLIHFIFLEQLTVHSSFLLINQIIFTTFRLNYSTLVLLYFNYHHLHIGPYCL